MALERMTHVKGNNPISERKPHCIHSRHFRTAANGKNWILVAPCVSSSYCHRALVSQADRWWWWSTSSSWRGGGYRYSRQRCSWAAAAGGLKEMIYYFHSFFERPRFSHWRVVTVYISDNLAWSDTSHQHNRVVNTYITITTTTTTWDTSEPSFLGQVSQKPMKFT